MTQNISINERFKLVLKQMANAQKKSSFDPVDLLAVSKKQPIEKIIKLYHLGQRSFGESYVSEAINKIQSLSSTGYDDIDWHFIGPLQSNKTKYIAQYFSWVQSVDSYKLLNRLNGQREQHTDEKLNVLFQLNIGNEATKRGLLKDDLLKLASKAHEFKHLSIRGIMCIPKAENQFELQYKQFKYCYDVFNELKKSLPVDTLSLGMSSDLSAAIAAGSTMVRVGTDLFSKRT